MPGESNTSFIPKRNPTKKDKVTARKQVYVGTLVIRVLFLAVLVASAALYFYEKKLSSDLNQAVSELDSRINSFNEEDMKNVIAVDKRLRQANSRLQNSASIVAVLKAIEESTTEATQINNLSLVRDDDNVFALTLAMEAQSFDAVKFQREVLGKERSEKFDAAEVEAIQVTNESDEADFLTSSTGEEAQVEILYNTLINIDASDIRHTPLLPVVGGDVLPPPVEAGLVEETANTVSEVVPVDSGEVNQENL